MASWSSATHHVQDDLAYVTLVISANVLQGTGHGHVYFTEDGQLIIRHETWSLLGRKPDFIVEDYCSLEEGGKVLVDRMCAFHFKTGQRAEQLQVVRLVSRPGQE
jgi:hypothetical protein